MTILLLLSLLVLSTGLTVNISNVAPRRDVAGNLMEYGLPLPCVSCVLHAAAPVPDGDREHSWGCRPSLAQPAAFSLTLLSLSRSIHDGSVIQFAPGGLYYYYGMGYRNCTEKNGYIPPLQCPGIYPKFGGCGFRTDHAVNAYTSPDLVEWTPASPAVAPDSPDVLPERMRPAGMYGL